MQFLLKTGKFNISKFLMNYHMSNSILVKPKTRNGTKENGTRNHTEREKIGLKFRPESFFKFFLLKKDNSVRLKYGILRLIIDGNGTLKDGMNFFFKVLRMLKFVPFPCFNFFFVPCFSLKKFKIYKNFPYGTFRFCLFYSGF